MHIRSFHLRNFKSYSDSGVHKVAEHMNLVVGQNNVGKTALLQALSTNFNGVPHKDSSFRREQAVPDHSILTLEFSASGQEFLDVLAQTGSQIHVPIPTIWGNDPKEMFEKLTKATNLIFSWELHRNSGGGSSHSPWPSLKLAPADKMNSSNSLRIQINKNDQSVDAIVGNGRNDNVGAFMGTHLTLRTYYFNAQRVPLSTAPSGTSTKLNANAENLAEVLSVFQPNTTLYNEYIGLVRRVIPAVKHVSVYPAANNTVEIRIWPVEENSKRDDLTIPLADCGTGVGQVLALLYVVSRTTGNVIVIDEPNSFLHPGAAKVLIAILREHKEHQFIISTHSPEVITAAEPQKLFLLSYVDEKTVLEEVDSKDLDQARRVLEEIGSKLSDVLGADAVVWVEGPTEGDCFPLLLESISRPLQAGETIAPLRNTGDLEGRQAEIVADIYRNMTSAGALFPKHMIISFDGDKKEHARSKALSLAFGNVLRFLPRRTYENYLLSAAAIEAVLRSLPTFKAEVLHEGEVDGWIRENGKSKSYSATNTEVWSNEWITQVHAPKLLNDLFQEISKGKEAYDKRLHGAALTKWLIANDPAAIKELVTYVRGLLP